MASCSFLPSSQKRNATAVSTNLAIFDHCVDLKLTLYVHSERVGSQDIYVHVGILGFVETSFFSW